jgi:hypothetical protein
MKPPYCNISSRAVPKDERDPPDLPKLYSRKTEKDAREAQTLQRVDRTFILHLLFKIVCWSLYECFATNPLDIVAKKRMTVIFLVLPFFTNESNPLNNIPRTIVLGGDGDGNDSVTFLIRFFFLHSQMGSSCGQSRASGG